MTKQRGTRTMTNQPEGADDDDQHQGSTEGERGV